MKKSLYQFGAYTDRLGIGSVRLIYQVQDFSKRAIIYAVRILTYSNLVEVFTYKAMNGYI